MDSVQQRRGIFSAKRCNSVENVVTRNIKTATRKEYVPENILNSSRRRMSAKHNFLIRPKTTKPRTEEHVYEYFFKNKSVKVRPKVWNQDEFERIKSVSKVVSHQERLRQMEEYEKQKQTENEQCIERKQLLREIDERNAMNRKNPAKNIKPFETEEQRKILDRAFFAKQEEQEEIKKANRIILAAKCHLIRDFQIAERNELEKERKEEELKLEREMAEERDRALREADEQLEREKEMNKKHAKEIEEQLRSREVARQIEAERIEEEAKQLQKAQSFLKTSGELRERRRWEQTIKLKAEFQKAYELSQWFKKVEFEQDRVAEMRIQEYMKIRKKREEQQELERRLAREQKEREHDRLLKQQQKVIDTKNEKFEIMVRREQERKEREYRQKEKDSVLKRIEQQKIILDARRTQQNELRRIKEQLELKESNEYNKNMERFNKELEKEKMSEEMRTKKREQYCIQILDQIKQREDQRKETRIRARNELEEMKKKELEREQTLNKVLKHKVQELKDSKIPDKLIKDVERQLNIV